MGSFDPVACPANTISAEASDDMFDCKVKALEAWGFTRPAIEESCCNQQSQRSSGL
jgi:hypothetical protein